MLNVAQARARGIGIMWSWTCPNRLGAVGIRAVPREAWTIADVRLTGLFMPLGASELSRTRA